MKVSREKLFSEAQSTGFRPEVLEKVARLLNLLEGFQSHPFLKGRLALKGGTALNLFLFDIPRLSVDIDLNYIGAADRSTMLQERPKVERAIQAVCSREDMNITRIPADHAGGKWQLQYDSFLDAGGRLEVDLNYMLRVALWPIQNCMTKQVGSFSAVNIPVLDLHELAAGKLAALFSRHASRDLFDAHQLLTKSNLDREKLRLGFVIYGAMNRKDWRKVKTDDVRYDIKEIKNHLMPVVRREVLTKQKVENWAKNMIAECRKRLEMVLPLFDSEIEFLNQLLGHGKIKPKLLTSDEDMIKRIEAHPMLQWKALHVRQYKLK